MDSFESQSRQRAFASLLRGGLPTSPCRAWLVSQFASAIPGCTTFSGRIASTNFVWHEPHGLASNFRGAANALSAAAIASKVSAEISTGSGMAPGPKRARGAVTEGLRKVAQYIAMRVPRMSDQRTDPGVRDVERPRRTLR